MMRLLVHCGFDKCGSTSIQSSLLSNRKMLANHGFLYPDTGLDKPVGHHRVLTNALLSYDPSPDPIKTPWLPHLHGSFHSFEALASLLTHEAEVSQAHSLIVSSEVISAPFFTSRELKKLRRIGGAVESVALFVVRPTLDYVRSRWMHKIRNDPSFKISLRRWYLLLRENDQLSFADRLQTVSDNFDEVIVVPFRKEGLVRAFWEAAGLPGSPVQADRPANVTPPARAHYMLYLLKSLGVSSPRMRSVVMQKGIGFNIQPFKAEFSSEMMKEMASIDKSLHEIVGRLRNVSYGYSAATAH